MAGIFGNHWVDRHLEGQLNRHLDEQDKVFCEHCQNEFDINDADDGDSPRCVVCPNCEKQIEVYI